MRRPDIIDLSGPTEVEIHNAAVLYARDLAKDTPGKTWWHADAWHPAIARALHIDASQDGAAFSLHPFRLTKIDGEYRILAAYPVPVTLCTDDEAPQDWLDIEIVISWNPATNAVEVMGDAQPQIVGTLDPYYLDAVPTIFGQPRAFFQQWAINRSRFWGFYQQCRGKAWTVLPKEPDLAPGALAIGPIAKVRFPRDLPEHLECVGIDPKAVTGAILRSIGLPRVTNSMKAAA